MRGKFNRRIKWAHLGLVWAMLLLSLPAVEITDHLATARSTSAWFEKYDSQSFRRTDAAARKIDLKKLDRDLLDAAVFHETNRRRQEYGLPPLKYHPTVRKMARIQSLAMAKLGTVSHTQPDPEKATTEDRAHFVGLQFSFLAENVASSFARKYKSGTPVYVEEREGRKILTYKPHGPTIPMHTYQSFAEALVEEWMQSPGHRKNILHPAPQYLGCACEPARKADEMSTFYDTQVFYTPLTDQLEDKQSADRNQ